MGYKDKKHPSIPGCFIRKEGWAVTVYDARDTTKSIPVAYVATKKEALTIAGIEVDKSPFNEAHITRLIRVFRPIAKRKKNAKRPD